MATQLTSGSLQLQDLKTVANSGGRPDAATDAALLYCVSGSLYFKNDSGTEFNLEEADADLTYQDDDGNRFTIDLGDSSKKPFFLVGANGITSTVSQGTASWSLDATNTRQTALSNLVTVGALAGGSIAAGFGTITTDNAISGAAGNFDAITGVSLDVQSGGISNAGAVAGATSVDGTGDLTMGTITMTGFSVDADGDTALKSLAVDDGSTVGCDSDTDLLTLNSATVTLASNAALQFHDSGEKITRSVDGYLDITAGTKVNITGALGVNSTITAGGAIVSAGSVTGVGIVAGGAVSSATNIDGTGDLTMGTITMTGFSVDADGDTALKSLAVDDGSTVGCDSDTDLLTLNSATVTLASNAALQFHDSGEKIARTADGYLDLTAGTRINMSGTVAMTAGCSGSAFSIGSTGLMTIGGVAASSNGLTLPNLPAIGIVKAKEFVTYSDATLKTNIKTIENPIEKVKAMRGVTYNMKNSINHREVGFLAQELRNSVPEVVSGKGDGDLGVDYGKLTSVLVEAVKAQQTQIEELKALLLKKND